MYLQVTQYKESITCNHHQKQPRRTVYLSIYPNTSGEIQHLKASYKTNSIKKQNYTSQLSQLLQK